MIEIDVDLVYLEDSEGLDRLVLHDENGEHADVYYKRVFARKDEPEEVD